MDDKHSAVRDTIIATASVVFTVSVIGFIHNFFFSPEDKRLGIIIPAIALSLLAIGVSFFLAKLVSLFRREKKQLPPA